MRKKLQTRGLLGEAKAIGDDRTVELSFSSTNPTPADPYVLQHGPENVDLSRLNNGGAVLLNHDHSQQIGVVEKAWLDGGKGRARIKFSRGQLGTEIFHDVMDGIRKLVSVGFWVEESQPGPRGTRLATKWQPVEISIVPVPSDATVGVGRSLDNSKSKTKKMKITLKELKEKRGAVHRRIEQIEAEAGDEGLDEDQEYLRSELVDLRDQYDEQLRGFRDSGYRPGSGSVFSGQRAFNIGNREDGRPRYSLLRALRSAGQGVLSGYEAEVHQEITRGNNREAAGIYVPLDAFVTRDLTVTGGTGGDQGGVMVQTDVNGFIDALRPRLTVAQLGATVLTGLVGNLSIPRQVAASSTTWKSENAALDEESPTFGSLDLSPKRVGAYTEVSKQLLVQTSGSAESMVRADLLAAIAISLDAAAINGSGSNGEPEGILQTTGIGSVLGGDNGAAPDWNDIVDLLQEIAIDNVDESKLGWLTNPKVRGKLLKTVVVGSTDSEMVWSRAQTLPGKWAVTNQVPSDLDKGTSTGVCSAIICGDFSHCVLATFGNFADVVVDPYTLATTGKTRVVVNAFCDVGIRRAEAFAAMKDALTA